MYSQYFSDIEDAAPFETEEPQPAAPKEAPKPGVLKPKQPSKPKLISPAEVTPPYKPPSKSTPDDVAVKILSMMKEWLTEQSLVFLNYLPESSTSVDTTVNEVGEIVENSTIEINKH